MGRWAQAQRRGGFTAPVVPTPAGSEWTVEYDGVDEAGDWIWDGFSQPPGTDGIVWQNGPDGDIDNQDGNHTGHAAFAALNVSGDATTMRYRFAWALGGVQVSEYCPIQAWHSV
jgi:hypothetical protein